MSIVPALKGFFGKFVFLHFCMPPRTKMHESCTIGLPRSEVVLIATWLLLDMHIVPSRTPSIHRSLNQSLISSIPLSIPPSIRGRCPEEKPFSLLFCYLGGLHIAPSLTQSINQSLTSPLPPSIHPGSLSRREAVPIATWLLRGPAHCCLRFVVLVCFIMVPCLHDAPENLDFCCTFLHIIDLLQIVQQNDAIAYCMLHFFFKIQFFHFCLLFCQNSMSNVCSICNRKYVRIAFT